MQAGVQRFATGDLTCRLPLPAGNELTIILTILREGILAINRREHIVRANRVAVEVLDTDPGGLGSRSVMEATRNLDLQIFIHCALASPDCL